MRKGLTKYNKVNRITPVTTHVQTTHLKLFVLKKQQLSEVAEHHVVHVQQLRNKRIGPSNCAITTFFGATILYKKMISNNNIFWKIWCFILARVTSLCLVVRTFGLKY
jgi:hypothetical protein